MSNVLLKNALALAQRGLRVFPIKPNLKFPPLLKEWEKKATTHPDLITGWWTKWPTANIAVATGKHSGVIVLDVDMKHGQNGEAELCKLETKHGPLPPTVETITPHKGRQLWFRAPDFAVKNSVGAIAPGLDVRGENGYVVAPPSCVSDKDGAGTYCWSVDSAKEFADPPAWMFPSAEIHPFRPREHFLRIARGVPNGSRNHDCASLTGKLARHGVDPELILTIMLAINAQNTPPEDEEIIVRTVNSVLATEAKRRGRL